MTLDYITSLTDAGESKTLKFKATTGTRREAAVTVSTFANQSGGQVLFRALLHKLMTREIRVDSLSQVFH